MIKAVSIEPESGPLAPNSVLGKTWGAVAKTYFNAHNNICGRAYDDPTLDDKGDPSTGLAVAQQLLASKDFTIVGNLGPGPSQTPEWQLMMKNHIVVLNQDSGNEFFYAPNNPTAFSVGPSVQQDAAATVNWAKAHGDNNIGLFNDGLSQGNEVTAADKVLIKAAGLTLTGVYTYSPTATDLTTFLTQARQAGVQTVFVTGFAGIPALVSGLKQIGWQPHLVGWGTLTDYGITAAQAPPDTVDGCLISYSAKGQESKTLTPEVKGLMTLAQKQIGNYLTNWGVLNTYEEILVLKYAIETAGSTDQAKIAQALLNAKTLPSVIPGLTLSFRGNPKIHTAWPNNGLHMCRLNPGPYDILYQAK